MESIQAFIHQLFVPEKLQAMMLGWGWLGYLILFAIIFAETGLFFGFFLPGDSLLFIAGFVCSPALGPNPPMNIYGLGALLMVAAIVGDTVGYWMGRKAGPMIFCREDSLLFHKKHVERTQHFYEKYGGKTIIYARFVPIVRTFAPIVAGVGKMDYGRFLRFNIFGGIGWIILMLLAGFQLGKVDWIKKHVDIAVLLVIFISILPLIFEVIRARGHKSQVTENPGIESAPAGE